MVKVKIEGTKIFNTVLIIIFSLMSVVCYSDDAIASETEKQVQVADANEQLKIDSVTTEEPDSDEFCVAESFNGLISWFAEKFEFLEEEYLSDSEDEKSADSFPEHELAEEESVVPSGPLDLTIPEVEHEGTMEIEDGIKTQLPDMFVEQKKPYVKEKPSASFGGRILMDDAELEGMEEYRLRDMSDAVRGAEVSLEFKTN